MPELLCAFLKPMGFTIAFAHFNNGILPTRSVSIGLVSVAETIRNRDYRSPVSGEVVVRQKRFITRWASGQGGIGVPQWTI